MTKTTKRIFRRFSEVAFTSIIAALLSASMASARDVTLAWDPSDDPAAAEYVVYWGTRSGDYPYSSRARGDVIPAGIATYTVTGLADDRTYFFAVKAVSDIGLASDFSNEAATPVISSLESGFDLTLGLGESYPLSGTAAALETVEVWAGATLAGTTSADADGDWSLWVDLAFLGDGPLEWSVASTGATSETVAGDLRWTDAPLAGDLNYLDGIDLADLLIALQIASGIPVPASPQRDVNGDGRIGLADAIFILRNVSGMRST